MHQDDHDDPDSGHPTPRDQFDPAEMLTSTPIPSARRRTFGLRPPANQLITEPFSPVGASRFSNSHSNEYNIMNGVIEMFKKNKRLEEDVDEMRNQSMMSEHELEEKDAKIAALQQELGEARAFTITAEVDLRRIKQEDASVGCTLEEEKWAEQEERLREDRRRAEEEKREMEERLVQAERALDEERQRAEQQGREWQSKYEASEAEKEQIMKRAATTVERNEADVREREQAMREAEEKRQQAMEALEKLLEEKEGELVERGRLIREADLELEALREAAAEMEAVRERNDQLQRDSETLTERLAELERAAAASGAESVRVRDLERRARELGAAVTVAEAAAAEAARRHEELRAVREEELAEALAVKTKVHQLQAAVEALERANERLEEKRREGDRAKHELETRTAEAAKMQMEMDELTREAERRREQQKRLEDELDIARKMSSDATREMTRIREAAEAERVAAAARGKADADADRMEWMDKELRDSEEVKRAVGAAREAAMREAAALLEEARASVHEEAAKYAQLEQDYLRLKHEFESFQVSAHEQYNTDLAARDEEAAALRERLAELENYPGRLVSVDGRFSDGRTLYDLFPAQLKEHLDASTDDSMRRAVACCRSMVIRGPIDNRETKGAAAAEEEEEAPPTLQQLQQEPRLAIFIDRLATVQLSSSSCRFLLDFLEKLFRQLEGAEERVMADLATGLVNELLDLDEQVAEAAKRSEDTGRRLREAEEERRAAEEESRRADEGRRRGAEEAKELRANLVRVRAERDAARAAAAAAREERREAEEEPEDGADEGSRRRSPLALLAEERDEARRAARMFENAAHEFKQQYEDLVAEADELAADVEQAARAHAEEKQRILERYERELEERTRKIAMLVEEGNEKERALENEISRNGELSREILHETNEAHRLEKALAEEARRVDKERRKREYLKNLLRAQIDGLRAHLGVHEKVKGRNMQRQALLDRCMFEIDEARAAMRTIEGRDCEQLDELQQTIASEVAQFRVGDARDDERSKQIVRSLPTDIEGDDKENRTF